MNTPTYPPDPAELESAPVDSSVVLMLRAQATRHLDSARSIAATDPEGGFALAYDAARKAALALCAAAGVRPRGAAHHATTFDAAARIVQTRTPRAEAARLTDALDAATELRRVRGGSEYRGEVVSPDELRDALEVADDLVTGLGPVTAGLLA